MSQLQGDGRPTEGDPAPGDPGSVGDGSAGAEATDATEAGSTDAFTFDDVTVVMGTYNEAAAIGTVLDDIDRVTDGRANVVCVDGSDDRTPEIARGHGARVVEQEPRGYGVAVRAAVLVADRPVVVTTDCDDTYPMEALPEFLSLVNDGADVVSGDRITPGADAMPALNRQGNRAFALLASALMGERVRDTTTGMRAYRREVVQEIDERLLSILTWADIPTSAGGTTYVSDDHFGAHPAADPVPIHSDPLPRLEAEQEHLLVNCLRDMTDSDETIVQEISADGGTHARDLSESTGLSLSTIYRCLERLDGVLESDNGHVQFVTKKLRQEVRTLFDSVQDHLESAADRVASLVDMDARQSASSAFDRWLKKYGAEFDAPAGDDDSPTIRIDTVLSRNKSTSQPMLSDAIDEMLSAWDRDGRDVRDLRDAIVKASVDFNRQSLVVSAIV